MINRILIGFCGFAFAVPTVFFIFCALRLISMNLRREEAAANLTPTMSAATVFFPIMAGSLGYITHLCFGKAIAGVKNK